MLIRVLLLALFLAFTAVEALRKGEGEKVLLSKVQTLTLRHGLKTSHRRVAAVPQLKCIGGNARGLYDVDIMRCKNQGSDYEDENIQWTCTASLPSEFKLGTTDVICEGYDSSSDPYVLKGSCGVEYRLIITDIGEQKYGHKRKGTFYDDDDYEGSGGGTFGAILFGLLFVGVLGWILYSAFFGSRAGNGVNRPFGGGGGGGGWGGGGGGGWFGGGGDDPPPPYSRHPPPSGRKSYPSSRTADASSWRPGFWSGAAAGAAGAYLAGNRGQRQQPPRPGGWNWAGGDNGEGSSNGRTRPSSSSSSSFSSARHSSSGFGGTSRR